ERGSTLRDVRSALSRVAPLQDLVNFRGAQFYHADSVSVNYETSRAVMLYLQEKNALAPMVKEVKKAKAANPYALPVATCREALEKALGGKMDRINDDFRAWVASARD